MEDGWVSERFSELASAQLGRLAQAMEMGPLPPVLAASLFTPSPICRMQAPPLETVVEDRGLLVRRMPGPSDAKSLPFAAWLSSPDSPFRALSDAHAKFKLFETGFADPARPSTRQYFTLSGRSPEGYREQNATWTAEWLWDAQGDEPPRIAALKLDAFEEVLILSAEARPLFRDAAHGVIGASPAYRNQLRYGNDYWRQRIELFNRFFKFGHQGLAIGDANGDGLEDLYVCQNGGLPNRLFLQNPDGTAEDQAAAAGVDLFDLTRSALFVDLDNDGDQDLILALDTGLVAFRNDGRGTFEPKLRYPKVRNAFGLTAADYDNDGDLDLFVCRYFANAEEGAGLAVPVPYFDANNGGGNFLIRNDGPSADPEDWLDFSDATAESGIETQNNRRFSFAAVWEDLDNDGDLDLFVANDFGLKNLYVNEEGKFRDVAVPAGVDDGGFGMSAAAADFDRDGIPDLYAGNMFSAAGSRVTRQPQFRPGLDPALLTRFQRMARGNSLFRGIGGPGAPRYADVSESAGVTVGRWSWGCIFADLNNDGWEDLVVANGFVSGIVPDDL